MLKGKNITLRPVRESDLDQFYELYSDIENRGNYYPRGIVSGTGFKKRFQESGFWSQHEGQLLIIGQTGEIIGQIEFFKTVNYLDEYELSYQVFAQEERGKGITTDAVNLLVRYLFDTKPVNRIRLVIHPDNAASRRVAEKCGFTHEGTARGAWFNKGQHHDVEIYSILRSEVLGPQPQAG
jgi:[ribosomal protein S5]-alanine N-acetyltransferase